MDTMTSSVVLVASNEVDQARLDPVLNAAAVVVVKVAPDEGSMTDADVDWLRSPARVSLAWIGSVADTNALAVALACDLVIADTNAVLDFAPATGGQLPVLGSVDALVNRVGSSRALALIVGGQIPADQAHQWGIVDRLASLESAMGWAEQISQYSPQWLAEVKALLRQAHLSSDQVLVRRREREALGRLASDGREAGEGISE
jgi:enoyl-CoA hydratase/carnithine racemase